MYTIETRTNRAVEHKEQELPSIVSSYQQHEIRDAHVMVKALLRKNEKESSLGLGPSLLKQSGFGMNRNKSFFSMESNITPSSESSFSSIDSTSSTEQDKGIGMGIGLGNSNNTRLPPVVRAVELDFVPEMRRFTGSSPEVPDFSSSSILRKVMEPHLRRARSLREESRSTSHLKVAPSIASSMGVPYTGLRRECPFLFDEHTHPLHLILADALQVEDLTQVHTVDEDALLLPLLDRERRYAFHSAYDNFVTSFCIPLLHTMAVSRRIIHLSACDRITYRYQAFPTIRISRPGCHELTAPVCDSMLGHSVGCLTFYVPLTPCEGTSCMYTESHPGREDWHALRTKSVGLGYLIDGARCLHFDLENTTNTSRVALTFRVMIYRDDSTTAGLCPPALLEDEFSKAGPGYYDEAVVDLRRADAVVKKHGNRLLDPNHRVGYPFL